METNSVQKETLVKKDQKIIEQNKYIEQLRNDLLTFKEGLRLKENHIGELKSRESQLEDTN